MPAPPDRDAKEPFRAATLAGAGRDAVAFSRTSVRAAKTHRFLIARSLTLGLSMLVLLISGLSAVGAFDASPANAQSRDGLPGVARPTSSGTPSDTVAKPTATPTAKPTAKPVAKPKANPAADVTAVPAKSGSGRRVVFDQSDQRVWLINAKGQVTRTYLVSGSRFDQLNPGSYNVYSKSRHATSWTGTSTMQYMVRFTQGPRASIGFHDIPLKNGEPVQTKADLGTRLSDGCIRQLTTDAKALWEFAPVGAKVVVVA